MRKGSADIYRCHLHCHADFAPFDINNPDKLLPSFKVKDMNRFFFLASANFTACFKICSFALRHQ